MAAMPRTEALEACLPSGREPEQAESSPERAGARQSQFGVVPVPGRSKADHHCAGVPWLAVHRVKPVLESTAPSFREVESPSRPMRPLRAEPEAARGGFRGAA